MTHGQDEDARAASGHRLLPHTADVLLAAWAPTVEECLAEAVRGLVAIFADVRTARSQRLVPFAGDPGPESELLVQLLEEVIYLLDAEDVVPVQVAVARTAEGGVVGEFAVTQRSHVTVIGPAPKAVTRHGLRFARDESVWRCEVIVDV